MITAVTRLFRSSTTWRAAGLGQSSHLAAAAGDWRSGPATSICFSRPRCGWDRSATLALYASASTTPTATPSTYSWDALPAAALPLSTSRRTPSSVHPKRAVRLRHLRGEGSGDRRAATKTPDLRVGGHPPQPGATPGRHCDASATRPVRGAGVIDPPPWHPRAAARPSEGSRVLCRRYRRKGRARLSALDAGTASYSQRYPRCTRTHGRRGCRR